MNHEQWHYSVFISNIVWLVVSIPLTNISQLGLLFPIYGKTYSKPPTSCELGPQLQHWGFGRNSIYTFPSFWTKPWESRLWRLVAFLRGPFRHGRSRRGRSAVPREYSAFCFEPSESKGSTRIWDGFYSIEMSWIPSGKHTKNLGKSSFLMDNWW